MKKLYYYRVPRDLEKEFLRFASGHRVEVLGPFLKSDCPPERALWYDEAYTHGVSLKMSSTNAAAEKLLQRASHWSQTPFKSKLSDTAAMIEKALQKKSGPIPRFLGPGETHSHGTWALIDQDSLGFEILMLHQNLNPIWIPTLTGIPKKLSSPPSQAYQKIWEALLRMPTRPETQDYCVDLGSSPGGWTWFLLQLGATVLSIDGAELHPSLNQNLNLQFLKKDAFKFDPKSLKRPPTWLFCDVICAPERLLPLIQCWTEAFPKIKCVFTLKFKGEAEIALVEKFQQIKNSRVVHLHHNKHELTWMSPA